MSGQEVEAVDDAIERTYGSLSKPDFSFVQKAQEQAPNACLMRRLAGRFDIEETTDENDDVSFQYVLRGGAKKAYGLSISMVGPFGLLTRIFGDRPSEVFTSPAPTDPPVERWLLRSLRESGIHLLSRDALERPSPLRRPGLEDEPTLVFHALIGFAEWLPWQKVVVPNEADAGAGAP
jgi:hypothetical protein